MPLFLPFSQNARTWEPIAMELRCRARVGNQDLLDPTVLAAKIGLTVLDWNTATAGLTPEEVTTIRAGAWSGGVLAKPLPDGSKICIINPEHSLRRNKITLMEEISHVHLGHVPTGIGQQADGLRFRSYDKAQETQAYGVGAAALLPWCTFYHALDSGRSVAELAEEYDVTEELVKYRIKITGGSKLYWARCRQK